MDGQLFLRPIGLARLIAFMGMMAIGELIAWADDPPHQNPASVAEVDFERDVRPIFFGGCVKCHGGEKPEAGLRLTDLTSVTAALESGNRAVVPGRPGESELLRRISAKDLDERMPPTGDALSSAEVDAIARWIAAGSPWPAHWAYRPLVRPGLAEGPVSLPADHSRSASGLSESPGLRTPIDHFVLEKLRERGLSPSPPADRRTLLRRVFLDLIGLPPAPEDYEAFLADNSPDAYERVVDRLLASPHFGERWARHWMDVVHYAESHGHDQDRPRENAWPYRDYLIRAFNEDRSYAQFVQDQVAGDVLSPGDPWALIATGFLAAGPWDESSLRDIRPDGFDRLIGQYLDRDDIVTATMNTFVSTTVQCARCHDHKFDPVSQREYYALQAVFGGTDKANRAFDFDPAVASRRESLAQELRLLTERSERNDPWLLQPERQARAAVWEEQRTKSTRWHVLTPVEYRSTEGATLTPQPDGSLLASGERPAQDTYTIVAHVDLSKIDGIRLEVLTDESLPKKGPGRADNGNLHLNELLVSIAKAPRSCNPSASEDSPNFTPLRLASPLADFDQQGWTIAHAIDGNPATAWGIHPQEGKPHEATFEVSNAPMKPRGSNPSASESYVLKFELQQTHGRGHVIGRVRLSVTDMPPPFSTSKLPDQITAALEVESSARTDEQRCRLAAYIERLRLEDQVAALPKPAMVYCGTNRFTADGTFTPAEKPRPVQLLERGNIQQPKDEIAPAALACLPSLTHQFELHHPDSESARRAALARWLSDSQNVLTWRSIANRLWHYHFGRGIVATPSDFGRMGAAPSHPELLDWLAIELRDHGGSLKHLQRLIVTSQVYRQVSQYDSEFAKIDSENVYLWRMNRRRLDAESIRDSVLAISGALDPTMGGPSVKQFIQTPGIHVTPKVDYLNFAVEDPAHNRRSIYRFVFRTIPDPFLETFDCPDASQFTPQRNESVSALQALAMLHDKFVVRQSERIAEEIARQNGGIDEQVAALYRMIHGRRPTGEESAAVSEYAKVHSLANACRFLLNSNEFLFVD